MLQNHSYDTIQTDIEAPINSALIMPWLQFSKRKWATGVRSIVSIPTTDATLVSTGSGSMSKSCKWGYTTLWCSQILCRIRIIAAAWHSRTFPGLGLPLDLNQPKTEHLAFKQEYSYIPYLQDMKRTKTAPCLIWPHQEQQSKSALSLDHLATEESKRSQLEGKDTPTKK